MGIFTKIMNENCLPFPHMVQIEITDRCALNCPQCYKPEIGARDADLDFIKKCIIQAKTEGAKIIVLNGGEPLMYGYIKELLCFVDKTEMDVNIFSSGYGIDSEIIELLRSPRVHYSLSLNGSTEMVNRCSRDGYEITVNAMKQLQHGRVCYGLHWVARHDNIRDFQSLIRLAEAKGAQYISIGCNKLTGTRTIQSPVDQDDLNELIMTIRSYTGKLKIAVENCYPELSYHLGLGLDSLFSGCGAGRTICNISLDGKFAPCTQLHYYEDYDDIKDYWKNSLVLQRLRARKLMKGVRCEGCSYKTRCMMCLATDIKSYNDFSSGSSTCLIGSE